MNEIWDVIESVSEVIPTYVCMTNIFRFSKALSHVTDFNARYKSLTAKLLRQSFFLFSCQHHGLVFQFHVGLNSLLQRYLSKQEFNRGLIYKSQRVVGRVISEKLSDFTNTLSIA